MAREFRAKIDGTDIWVCGGVFDNGKTAVIMSMQDGLGEKSNTFYCHIINKETICESTGKRDEKKKELFTNDIIAAFCNNIFVGDFVIRYSQTECAYIGYSLSVDKKFIRLTDNYTYQYISDTFHNTKAGDLTNVASR